ncbi:MAG: biopolymer transporter ExbD [Opitutaceae bacterium]
MAGSSPKAEEGKKKARIEIIPLIDVIFFLLATFVLFTLSLQRIASLPVQLPVAAPPGPPNPNDTTVYLQVSEDGTYYWKQGGGTAELISVGEIAPKLADYKRSESAPRILIRGDNKAKFGAAVFALDEVRKAGIDQVSVETVSSPTGR